MKKLLIILFFSKLAVASIHDEVLLASCQVTGNLLFSSCVQTPPTTPEQAAACTALYTKFTACSTLLNAPEPMILSRDPDPYVLSPYDPCRFEVQHFILFNICPNLPI